MPGLAEVCHSQLGPFLLPSLNVLEILRGHSLQSLRPLQTLSMTSKLTQWTIRTGREKQQLLTSTFRGIEKHCWKFDGYQGPLCFGLVEHLCVLSTQLKLLSLKFSDDNQNISNFIGEVTKLNFKASNVTCCSWHFRFQE